MAEQKKYTFKYILVAAVWILLGSGILVLLVAAITRKNNEQITGIEISISGVQNNYFIDKKDVMKLLVKINGKNPGKARISSLNPAAMEKALQKEQWIKRAEIFFDNNNVMQITITEREPVARIFTSGGTSFYLDTSLKRLPLSDKFSARLPVFTNFPTEVIVLSKPDSLLLKEIKVLSEFIGSDPFWMAQIEQVDITPSHTFELIPKLGKQVIRFGSAANYKEKFNKLLAFYKQVETRTGWNRYSILDLQYKNQVVAVNRDAKEIKMDSLLSVQIMKNIIADAQKHTSDSGNVQLIEPEDDNPINHSQVLNNNTGEGSGAIKTNEDNGKDNDEGTRNEDSEKLRSITPTPSKAKVTVNLPSSGEKLKTHAVKKAITKKTETKKTETKKTKIRQEELNIREEKTEQQPKAVMPPKSDY